MDVPDGLLRGAVDTLPTEIAILDADGTIRYTNRAWQSFGEANGVVGDPSMVGESYLAVSDAGNDEYARRAAEGIRRVLGGSESLFTLEYPCHGPDEDRWFMMSANGYEYGGHRYVQVDHFDITDRKLSELAVREKNGRLEAVASVLSHDIRNPLNVATGYLEILAERFGDEPGEVGEIRGSLARIETIITDALVLARRTDVGTTEPVELAECATEAWDHVDSADASLTVAGDLRFEADASVLENLFENLFRNAVDHAGSTATVTVGPLASGTGFYVEDDGPGIPRDRRGRVFDSGVTTGDGENTGLGLSIVRSICDAHDWTVDVTDAAAGGARFEIRGVTLV